LHVVIFIGINDIAFPGTTIEPGGIVGMSDEIIDGLQTIDRASTPPLHQGYWQPACAIQNAYAGGPHQGYFMPDKEAERLAVNKWIRPL
jgi:hypothetical protein